MAGYIQLYAISAFLPLFGIVVAYQSYQLLVCCRQYVIRQKRRNRRLLSSLGLIALTTLPTFAFTPIGIIPTAILLITLLVSMAIHKPTKKVEPVHFQPETLLAHGISE